MCRHRFEASPPRTLDINLFEEFVRNEIYCFIGMNDDPKDFYGHIFYDKKEKFKIMKGDRVKLMDVVGFAKIKFAEAGHHFFIESKQISHSTSSNPLCSRELTDNLEYNQPMQAEYNLGVTANTDDSNAIVTLHATSRNRITNFPHDDNSIDEELQNKSALKNAQLKVDNDMENVDDSTKDREIEPQVQSLNCPKVNQEQANDINLNPNGVRTLTRAHSDIFVAKMKLTYQLRNSKKTKFIEDNPKRTEDFTAATKLPTEATRRKSNRRIQSTLSAKDLLTTVSSSSSNIVFSRSNVGIDAGQRNSTIAEFVASSTGIPENFPIKTFCCDICGHTFKSKSEIKQHMIFTTGVKSHTCKVCERPFSFSSDLRRHLRIQTGEKPFACDVCPTAFNVSSALSRYKRTHTGEKPYVCEVCTKAFRNSSHLSRHKRTHTGEKSFPCDVCPKAFIDPSSLSRHKRIHTGEKTYACDVCPKAFNVSSNLLRHKRIHSAFK